MATPKLNVLKAIAEPPFEWAEDEFIPSTGSVQTRDLVEKKYNESIEKGKALYDLGIEYLEDLNSVITTYTAPNIDDFIVTIPTISVSPDSRPAPDLSGIDTDFPTFDTTVPTLTALPTIDLTNLNPADLPAEITAAINWVEQSHDNSLFTDLLARMLADLQSGATGLDATVEAAIFARAQARQTVEEDKIQTEIEEYFASTGFDLPTGALAARLQEHANGRAMRTLDMTQKIAIDQAELAQKNSQFVIQAAKDLEAVLRSFTDKKNDRSLDYAKAAAANAIAIYAEGVRAYIAAAEANKAYVEVQVENLKAVVEYNKGLIAAYAAEGEAHGIVIEAKAKGNEAITEIYKAEVQGYEAETRAVIAAQGITVEEYKLKLQNADIQLRTAIAEVEAALKGYEVESSLRERAAETMASLTMQAVASMYGSVHMAAGVSHSTGVSRGETFGHTESRSLDYGKREGATESHNFEWDTDKLA